MKFKYTILYVENVRKTLDFYVTAFGLQQKMLHESGDYGELDTGSTVLAFSSLELMESLSKAPKKARLDAPVFEIAFESDNVEMALEQAIQAGAKPVQPATQMPWGQTVGYVSDQNGFLIEICTKVSP